ncbi:MAG: hypothetical protein JJU36_07030 [Phycisphaeraceae bacterium]|nr:hypothetical protein [Phycisphaeraceae bacterium]
MAVISSRDAAKICSAPELSLVKNSFERSLKAFTEKKLITQIDRARKLRDKFKGEASRQKREMRGKADPRGTRAATRNDRTLKKAQLFAETLARFEDKLMRLRASAENSGNAGKSAKARTGTTSKSRDTAGRASARTAKTAMKIKKAEKVEKSEKTEKATKAAAPTAKTSAKATPASPAPDKAATGPKTAKPKRSGGPKMASTVPGNPGSTPAALAVLEEITSRHSRRAAKHEQSKLGREKNRFAGTQAKRVRGHVSAATKRRQARRDSKS